MNDRTEAILEVRHLTKRYGGLTAVDDVSFAVRRGSITAIIGPNGAGKSTCFNLIGGHVRPSAGTLHFEGADVTGMPEYAIARLGIARTFQSTALFRTMSVLDNAIVGARKHVRATLLDALLRTPRHGKSEREATERAREALAFVGLDRSAALPAAALSQEAQRRLAIAIALAGEPRLLLLDEPVAGVSHEEIAEHVALIRRIAASGRTVCLVEHKMQVVMGLADTIVVLQQGRKIAEGPPAAIASDPLVIDAYLGAARVA